MSEKQKFKLAERIAVHCKFDKMVKPDLLKPNPRNPVTHPVEQIRLLADIILKTGWRRAIVVSKRSGLIVRGHGAMQAAVLIGTDAPVEYQNFGSDKEETTHLIADNRLSELHEWNNAGLGALLQSVEDEISMTGYSVSDIDDLISQVEPVKLKKLEIKSPPKMQWILIGIPLTRFSSIAPQVECIAKVSGVIMQQTSSDHVPKNRQP